MTWLQSKHLIKALPGLLFYGWTPLWQSCSLGLPSALMSFWCWVSASTMQVICCLQQVGRLCCLAVLTARYAMPALPTVVVDAAESCHLMV